MRTLLPRPTMADRGLVLLIAVLCTCITVAAAATSLWLRTSADDMAAEVFRNANPTATQLRVSYAETPDLGVPPAAAEEVDQALAPGLRDSYDPPRYVVATNELVPKALPARSGEPAFLSVVGFPNLRDLVELVEGRWPNAGSAERELPPEVAAAYDGPSTKPVMEVVLEETTAAEMDLPVGTYAELSGASYTGVSNLTPIMRVAGIYRARDPFPSALDDVDTAREPSISIQPEFNLVRGSALAADEVTVLGAAWVERPSVRWTFDLAEIPKADQLTTLAEESRRAELQAWPPVIESTDANATTSLGDIAETALSERRVSDGLVALVVAALAAGALALLLAAAHVLATRRSSVSDVVRARGASGRWLIVVRGGEALLLTMPGVVVAGVAVSVVGGGIALRDVATAAAVGLVCAALITAAQTFPGLPGRESIRLAVRDALQLVLVALAVGATLLVLLGGERRPDDPVMLLLPPLLGAAAAVLLIRGLQVGLGGLRRLTRRTRTTAPVVSLSQASDIARQVVVAVAALVLAASAGILALAVDDTMRAGAERTGWEQVGADVSVTTSGLRDDTVARLAEVPGVSAIAPVFITDSVSVDTRTGIEGVQLLGVDPAALARVGEERLRDLDLPKSDDGAVAAVASSDLALDDQQATLLYAQERVPLQVVDRFEELPGLTEGGSFVLVDLAALEQATDRTFDSYDTILIEGDPDPAAVREVARSVDPQALVHSRTGLSQQQLDRPPVARTAALLPLATGASAVLALFAVVLVVGLGRPAGRRTSDVLTAVGADVRQRRRVHVLALLPVVVGGCLAAVGCGLLLTLVAGAGFDLATLTDTVATLAVRPGPWSGLGIAGFLAALVLVAIASGRPPSAEPAVPSEPDRERR